MICLEMKAGGVGQVGAGAVLGQCQLLVHTAYNHQKNICTLLLFGVEKYSYLLKNIYPCALAWPHTSQLLPEL